MGSYRTVDPETNAPPSSGPTSLPRGLDRLLELQQLDLKIDRLVARLRELEGGEDLRAARAHLSQQEARLGELRLAADAVGKEQGRLEGDVDLLQRKIDAERRRMIDGSVVNPRELQAIEAEVRNLEGRRSRAEDLILEQMERWEDLQGRLGPLEREEAEARERLAAVEQGSARELVELEQALEERRSERGQLLPAFDPELLELYDDLRRQKRGVGAAALVDGVCQACHQELSPMYIDRLKRSEGIRRCEHCRRILIF